MRRMGKREKKKMRKGGKEIIERKEVRKEGRKNYLLPCWPGLEKYPVLRAGKNMWQVAGEEMLDQL